MNWCFFKMTPRDRMQFEMTPFYFGCYNIYNGLWIFQRVTSFWTISSLLKQYLDGYIYMLNPQIFHRNFKNFFFYFSCTFKIFLCDLLPLSEFEVSANLRYRFSTKVDHSILEGYILLNLGTWGNNFLKEIPWIWLDIFLYIYVMTWFLNDVTYITH